MFLIKIQINYQMHPLSMFYLLASKQLNINYIVIFSFVVGLSLRMNTYFPLFCIKYRFEIYNLQFKSDGSMRRLSIDGPNTGDWYAVAFISWTDPNNDRIEQQGESQFLLIILQKIRFFFTPSFVSQSNHKSHFTIKSNVYTGRP